MNPKQLGLNDYFSNHWNPGDKRTTTSQETISKLILPHEWVLDVGCGLNLFKNYINNVIGVDPSFDEADHKCTIEEYIPDRLFDVATCLGSINFGDDSVIDAQISKIVSCLTQNSRIYWRLNPGRKDHDNKHCVDIDFYPWTFDKLKEYADRHGFQQLNESTEQHETRPRLYAEWHRIAK